MSAIDLYLGRDPGLWHGFAAEPAAELARRYPFREGEGRVRRGEEGVDYRFRALDRPGFERCFLFHFAEARLVFIETDYWSLDEAVCARTIAALGPPPERMEGVFRDDVVADGEWLYPARGLALLVMPETGLIARWTAFAPTSRGDYRRAIRPSERTREFIARGS